MNGEGEHPVNQVPPPITDFEALLVRNIRRANTEVEHLRHSFDTILDNIQDRNLPLGANAGVFGGQFIRSANNFFIEISHYLNVVTSNLLQQFPDYVGELPAPVFGIARAQVRNRPAVVSDSVVDSTSADVSQANLSHNQSREEGADEQEHNNLVVPEVQGELEHNEEEIAEAEEPIEHPNFDDDENGDDQQPVPPNDEGVAADDDEDLVPAAMEDKPDPETNAEETRAGDDSTFHSASDKSTPVRIEQPTAHPDNEESPGANCTHLTMSMCLSDCSMVNENEDDEGESLYVSIDASSVQDPIPGGGEEETIQSEDETFPDLDSLELVEKPQVKNETEGNDVQRNLPINEVEEHLEIEPFHDATPVPVPVVEVIESYYDPISEEEDPRDFLPATPGVSKEENTEGEFSGLSDLELEDYDPPPVPDVEDESSDSVSRVEETREWESRLDLESEVEEEPLYVETKKPVIVIRKCSVVLERVDDEALMEHYERSYVDDFQVPEGVQAEENPEDQECEEGDQMESESVPDEEEQLDVDVDRNAPQPGPGPSSANTSESKHQEPGEPGSLKSKRETEKQSKTTDQKSFCVDTFLKETRAQLAEAIDTIHKLKRGEWGDLVPMLKEIRKKRKQELEQRRREQEEEDARRCPEETGVGNQGGLDDSAANGGEMTTGDGGAPNKKRRRTRPSRVERFLATMSLTTPIQSSDEEDVEPEKGFTFMEMIRSPAKSSTTAAAGEQPIPAPSREAQGPNHEVPEGLEPPGQESVTIVEDGDNTDDEFNSDASDMSVSWDETLAAPKLRKKRATVKQRNQKSRREKGNSHSQFDTAEIARMEKLLKGEIDKAKPPPPATVITINDSSDEVEILDVRRQYDDDIQEIAMVPGEVEVLSISGKGNKRRKNAVKEQAPSPSTSVSTCLPSDSEEEWHRNPFNKKRKTEKGMKMEEEEEQEHDQEQEEDSNEIPNASPVVPDLTNELERTFGRDVMDIEEAAVSLPVLPPESPPRTAVEAEHPMSTPTIAEVGPESQSLLSPTNSQDNPNTPSSSLNSSAVSVPALASRVRRKGRRSIRKEREVVTTQMAAELRIAELVNKESQQIEDLNKECLSLKLSVSPHPLIEIDYSIASKLKDHQRDGIRFLWTSTFISVEHASGPGDGGILSHCMGLGKTLQALAFLHTLLTHEFLGIKNCLILCPLNVANNWQDEFKKWLMPDQVKQKVPFYNLSVPSNREKLKSLEAYQQTGGIALIHYEGLLTLLQVRNRGAAGAGNEPDETQPSASQSSVNFRKALLKTLAEEVLMKAQVLVCDEGHILRNDGTLLHQTIKRIETKRKIMLTGTPMQNNLMEYYYMIDIIKPNVLGDKALFANNFYNPINNGQHYDSLKEDIERAKRCEYRLSKMTQHFIHRQFYDVLRKLLPEPKHEYAIFLNLTPTQQNLYVKYIETIKNTIAESGARPDVSKRLFSDLSIIQKFCCHPLLLYKKSEGTTGRPKQKSRKCVEVEDEVEDEVEEEIVDTDWTDSVIPKDGREQFCSDYGLSAKMLVLKEIMETTFKEREKLLIFSRYHSTLDVITTFIEQDAFGLGQLEFGKHYYRVDGTTPQETRHKYCNIFNKSKRAKLFLITTKAGGLGVNLHSANRVVMVDVSMNPADDQQSVFRIYRIGQTKPCYIYRLICRGGMEEKIYNRCLVKLAIGGRVVDQQLSSRSVSLENTANLYEYNPDSVPVGAVDPAKPVVDPVLRKLLENPQLVASYVEHEALLEDNIEEHLNEEQKEKARNEVITPPPERKGRGRPKGASKLPRKGPKLMPPLQLLNQECRVG